MGDLLLLFHIFFKCFMFVHDTFIRLWQLNCKINDGEFISKMLTLFFPEQPMEEEER